MTFKVAIIRHGETDFNVNSLIHTISNDTINDNGREQASKLGKLLSERKFTKAFSSDLQRCQDTAKGVFQNNSHPVPELVIDTRLRERSFGSWDGKPMSFIFLMAKEQNKPLAEISAPDGETYRESQLRIINFWEDLLKIRDETEGDEEVVIFSHGLMIQALMTHLNNSRDSFDLENFEYKTMTFSSNTARSEFVIEKPDQATGKRKLIFSCLHDQSHLE